MAKLYTSSIGVAIEVDTRLDPSILATASSVTLKVKTPGGQTTTWDSNIVSGSSRIRHSISSGDLPMAGTYKLQASVTFTGGPIDGDTVNLQVFDPFK